MSWKCNCDWKWEQSQHKFLSRAHFHYRSITKSIFGVWLQVVLQLENQPGSDMQSVHGCFSNKTAGQFLALLLMISTHCWEKSHPSSKCWKASPKNKNREGNGKLCLCAQAWVYRSVTACVFWLAQFFASSQTCVWHLHARMTEPPAAMQNFPSVVPCFKVFHQLLGTVQIYWTVTDILISATCKGANRAIYD